MESEKHEEAVQAACAAAFTALGHVIDSGGLEQEGDDEANIRALREAIERLRDLALSPR
jgi:hypothetical protein